MRMEPYRRVLALPGVRMLILLALVMRVPFTAAPIALTLHVVLGLERGYGAAGLAGAAFTIGVAVGAPLLGRFVDRRGLRPMLALTIVSATAFYGFAPVLPYPALLGVALIGGVLAIPIFSVVRQSLAALVPEEQRKPAYSIESMSVELSFMAGPPLAVLVVTQASTRTAMWLVGAAIVLAGVGMWLTNPPTRAAGEPPAAPESTVSRRTWLRPRLVAVLLVAVATTVALAGTDVAVIAVLRDAGQVQWAGLVLSLWGAYSLVGGFVYGALPHSPSPLALATALGLTTIPLGLAPSWIWLCLLLIPAGALCAPTLAASADAVSRLVPAAARGEAMGLHGSSLTVGMALGAPLAGAFVDAYGPTSGFAVVGIACLVLAALGLAVMRWRGGTGVPAQEPAAEPAMARR